MIRKAILITILLNSIMITMCSTERYTNIEYGFSFEIPEDVVLVDVGELYRDYRDRIENKVFVRVFVWSPTDILGGEEHFLEIKTAIENAEERDIYDCTVLDRLIIDGKNVFTGSIPHFVKGIFFVSGNKLIRIVFGSNLITKMVHVNGTPHDNPLMEIFSHYYQIYENQGSREAVEVLAYKAMEADIRNGNPMNVPQEYVDLVLKFDEIVNSLELF